MNNTMSEQKKKLISVVVPVYNVEKYLEKCIESLLGQTYENIEIILVDDGSTDCSFHICHKYERLDNRIRLIHKENGGLSSARNTGIKEAIGQYITFIDSDDYVSKYYVETLARHASANSISIIGHQKVLEGEKEVERSYSDDQAKCVEKKDIFKLFLLDNNMVSAWGKLFPLSYFDTVYFPEGKIYEDFSTIYKLYDQATEFYVYDKELYFYLIRGKSITSSSFSKKNLDFLPACDEVEAFIWENKLDYLQGYFVDKKIRSYLTIMDKYMGSGSPKEYAEDVEPIKAYLSREKLTLLFNKKITLKTKMAFIAYRVSPGLFAFLMNHKKR